MRILRLIAAWIAALVLLVWRLTCRYRTLDDPRPGLRQTDRTYAYAILHAHQVNAVFYNDEARIVAMVSRSADGDLLVPSLHLRRVGAVRGSSRKRGRDKGGRSALAELKEVVQGKTPALIAVDGPQGPRNTIHRGIAELSLDTQTPIVPGVVVSSPRWILSRTWDRLQIPKPFSTVTGCFAGPIYPNGHTIESLRAEVGRVLNELERRLDPEEASRVGGK